MTELTALAKHHLTLGAALAPDSIPLDYGDQALELAAARQAAVLLDRSHEGRILLQGPDRLALVNRMSTNDVARLTPQQGAPTLFTNANARILFRALCAEIPQGLLLISEAGQGAALAHYLRRNIFFGDRAELNDISAQTALFALHGAKAEAVIAALDADLPSVPPYGSRQLTVAGISVTAIRRKPLLGSHWQLLCPLEDAAALHQALLDAGAGNGLAPAGSLSYNSLRIASGQPARLELSPQYLPLEVGLWDEVSFNKGCYTGQEIIARMESRQRLAKTLVKIELSGYVPAPAPVQHAGRAVGAMTSSVAAADGALYALGVVKLGFAKPGQALQVGAEAVAARVIGFAGAQAPFLLHAAPAT